MIKIQANNKAIIPTQFNYTTRLNNLDSADISYIYDGISYSEIETSLISVKEDNRTLFEGLVLSRDSDNSTADTTVNLQLVGKLEYLKRSKVGLQTLTNQNIIEFLNKADSRIIFEDYNLESYQKTISISTTNQSYFEFLNNLVKKLGVYFWYDYIADRCYIGTPAKVINISDQDILCGKFVIDGGILSTKESMVNRLYGAGGGLTKLGLDNVDAGLVQTLGYEIKQDDSGHYIEDADSVNTYGLYEEQYNSPDIQVANGSDSNVTIASNLLYISVVNELKKRKNPITQIQAVKYFISPITSEFLDNSNVFVLNCKENPNSKVSEQVTGKLYITDITYTPQLNSIEGYATCTLSDSILRDGSNELIADYSLSLNRPQNSAKTSSYTLQFPSVTASSGDLVKTFVLDSNIKKINKFEIYIKGSLVSGSSLSFNLSVDSFNLNGVVGAINLTSTISTTIPSSGFVDIFTSTTKEEIKVLSDPSATHFIVLSSPSGSGVGTIDVYINVTAEY